MVIPLTGFSRKGYRLAERRDPACATAAGSGQVGWRSHRPRAEKGPFRTETRLAGQIVSCRSPDEPPASQNLSCSRPEFSRVKKRQFP